MCSHRSFSSKLRSCFPEDTSFSSGTVGTLTAFALFFFTFAAFSPGPLVAEEDPPTLIWTFDMDSPGSLPGGFVIGTVFDGRPAGEWKVTPADRPQSPPHVLAQLQGSGAEHAYKVVLANNTVSSDIDLEVSLMAIEGKGDMGGGLVWRAADDRNYYLVRANPLEQNIRIYRVVNGVRKMLQNHNKIIEVNRWHALRVVARGSHVEVWYDGIHVLKLSDPTFSRGRIGLWTKADAVTHFDDLRLRVLR